MFFPEKDEKIGTTEDVYYIPDLKIIFLVSDDY